MVDRNRVRLLSGMIASVLFPGLMGCAGPYRAAPAPYGYPPYYYDYYYYPDVYVYFHIYTGWYYYWYDGIWWRVRELPPYIHLHPHYRVLLSIREDYPYFRNDEHRRRYPPPQRPPAGGPPSTSMPPREGIAPPAPQSPLPPQPRPELKGDREERERNLQRYDEYRKKPWIMPRR